MRNYTRTLITAFVQANTVRGNRYIDDAGQIVNDWEETFPQWEMGLQGMKMSNQQATMRELNVDTKRIWVRFEEPESLHEVSRQSRRVIDSVSRTIGVDTFSRLGFRLHYVVSYPDDPEFAYAYYKNVFTSDVARLMETMTMDEKHSFELNLPLKDGDLNIVLRTAPVMRTEEADPDKLPTLGIMFDADAYITTPTRVQLIGAFFKEVEQWTNRGLPALIAQFLREDTK